MSSNKRPQLVDVLMLCLLVLRWRNCIVAKPVGFHRCTMRLRFRHPLFCCIARIKSSRLERHAVWQVLDALPAGEACSRTTRQNHQPIEKRPACERARKLVVLAGFPQISKLAPSLRSLQQRRGDVNNGPLRMAGSRQAEIRSRRTCGLYSCIERTSVWTRRI